jgi:hypothetical protein
VSADRLGELPGRCRPRDTDGANGKLRSAVAGLLYTVTTPTIAFTYLAVWMLIALTTLGWAAAPGRGDYTD